MARNALEELAQYLTRKPRDPVRLTGSSVATGSTDTDSRVDGLPMPLGDEGDVLTIVDDGGDLVPAWEPASAVVTGRYRALVTVWNTSDDAILLVNDGNNEAVYTLESLE